VRWFVIAGILILLGVWCFYDAKVKGKYPYPEKGLDDTSEFISYAFNHWGPILFVPVGILCIVGGAMSMRRVLVADAEGIGFAGKQKLPWSACTRVDKSRLEEKGILHLYFGEKKLPLDQWKLRYFRELLDFVQAHCPGAENLLEGLDTGPSA